MKVFLLLRVKKTLQQKQESQYFFINFFLYYFLTYLKIAFFILKLYLAHNKKTLHFFFAKTIVSWHQLYHQQHPDVKLLILPLPIDFVLLIFQVNLALMVL